jgi:hypothetical protein
MGKYERWYSRINCCERYYTVMTEKAAKHSAASIRTNTAHMMKFQQSSNACVYLHMEV